MFPGGRGDDFVPASHSRGFNVDVLGPLLKEEIRAIRDYSFNYYS
jgi:hypothetical protein